MSKAERHSTMLLIAVLLLVVGVGNLWIGQSKSSYYAKALLESSTPTKDHPHGKDSPDSPYVKRLRSRTNYYNIVRFGGAGMICIGLAIVLVQLTAYRRSRS